jgi:hypothetical protein
MSLLTVTGKAVAAWTVSPTLAVFAQIGLVSANATLVPAGTMIVDF